jgi:hypothetical protein
MVWSLTSEEPLVDVRLARPVMCSGDGPYPDAAHSPSLAESTDHQRSDKVDRVRIANHHCISTLAVEQCGAVFEAHHGDAKIAARTLHSLVNVYSAANHRARCSELFQTRPNVLSTLAH